MLNKLALAFVMASAASGALAQSTTEIAAAKGRSAYVEDSNGNIMRTPFGHCWRSALWTPADAVPGCDGDLTPPVLKPTAPPLAAGSNQPVAVVAPVAAAPKRCDATFAMQNAGLFKGRGALLSTAGKKQLAQEVSGKLAGCRKVDALEIATGADGALSKEAQKLAARRTSAAVAYLKSRGMTPQAGALGQASAGSTAVTIRGVAK
jgi:OOP family OmpA-OmpF porin